MELDSGYQPVRKYFHGLGMDDAECHIEYSEVTDWNNIFQFPYADGWYFYLKDQVGTVSKVVDLKNWELADERTYDVFGNIVSQTGTPKTPLGFQGKYYDQESGLYYFYNRYYNPVNGRFINEDPIGLNGGLNMFQFVGNNPVQLKDPYGLYNVVMDQNEMDFYQGMIEGIYYFGKYYKYMREANTIGADKYFHCMANCMAAKAGNGGFFISLIISWTREFIDENFKGDPASVCNADRAANRLGRYVKKYMSCKDVCQPLRPCNLDKKY